MDGLTEEDSVGEFAEVEQPFRQYPASQTDLPAFFPCQQTHLPSSVCWLMRILRFLNIFCLCVCFRECEQQQCASNDNGAGAEPRLYGNWGPRWLTLSKSDTQSPAGWRRQ